jgi:hypothetical protein
MQLNEGAMRAKQVSEAMQRQFIAPELFKPCAERQMTEIGVVSRSVTRAHVAFFDSVNKDLALDVRPGRLASLCDACEQLFLHEGERTQAFTEFCNVRLVCVFCYATIKERHSPLH